MLMVTHLAILLFGVGDSKLMTQHMFMYS